MILRIRRLVAFLILAAAGAAGLLGQDAAPPVREEADVPVERRDRTGHFLQQHASFLERGRSGPVDLLFLGDSITAGWARVPHIWDRYYGHRRTANFGIGGDRTQHVLWRIENGELDAIAPEAVVLMLGTNNSGSHSAAEIVAAMEKLVGTIRTKVPETKVLLLAIFPRGARKDADGRITPAAEADAARRMKTIAEVNAGLARLDDGRHVRFLDVGEVFLGQDGRIPFSIMPDQLHLSPAGYQLWADAMEPLLSEMLGETR
jgi:lysophospholipase L1-like esterase